MDAPAVLYALRWLIYDTFRQALSSRIFWIMLGCSTMCIVFCLGVQVDANVVNEENELVNKKTHKVFLPIPAVENIKKKGRVDLEPGEPGKISLMFGLFTSTWDRKEDDAVHFLLSIFSSWIAGTVGIVLALVFTSGFLPEALQPSAASVLLAKPVPRWLFLLGKYLGVVCFVALHTTIFFVGTWGALGLRTGIWEMEYLLGIPILVFHFATIFSFSVMLAVSFRSTMACVVGVVLFWVTCYAMNYGRHFAVVYGDLDRGALSALEGVRKGTIKKVDAAKNVLTITVDGKDKDFLVTAKTRVISGADQKRIDNPFQENTIGENTTVMFIADEKDGKIAQIAVGGPALSGLTVFLSELGYWLLPKPADFRIILEQSLNLTSVTISIEKQEPFKTLLREEKNLFHPILAILSSCGFSIFALWASASQLAKTDY